MIRRGKIIRILAAALAVLLLAGTASAESPLFDFSDRDYVLPIDFTPGTAPKKEKQTGLTAYEDSTIAVTITEDVSGTSYYWVADIVISDASQIRTMGSSWEGDFSNVGTRTAESLTERAAAVLAINGDMFTSSEKKGLGYAIRQGILYKDHLDTSGKWNSRLMDLLFIDEDGDFHVLRQAEEGQAQPRVDGKRVLNAFCFGPALVLDGQPVEDFQKADRWFDMATEKERGRICLCQAGPLHYKVICVSGNYHGYTGMTLPQFRDLVAQQGVQTAYNLDGGDSVWLALNGDRVNNIGSKSERKLMDIIYFASAEP